MRRRTQSTIARPGEGTGTRTGGEDTIEHQPLERGEVEAKVPEGKDTHGPLEIASVLQKRPGKGGQEGVANAPGPDDRPQGLQSAPEDGSSEDRTLRCVRSVGKIGNLVEFPLHLHTEVQIAVGPDPAQARIALKDRAVVAVGQKHLGSADPSFASADDSDPSDVLQFRAHWSIDLLVLMRSRALARTRERQSTC